MGVRRERGVMGSRPLPVIFQQQKEEDKLRLLQWAAC